jgi:hypothetical protein
MWGWEEEEGGGGEQGGEMTQTMYAHVNKWIIKKRKLLSNFDNKKKKLNEL